MQLYVSRRSRYAVVFWCSAHTAKSTRRVILAGAFRVIVRARGILTIPSIPPRSSERENLFVEVFNFIARQDVSVRFAY